MDARREGPKSPCQVIGRRWEENGACHMGQAKQQYMVDQLLAKATWGTRPSTSTKSFVIKTDRPEEHPSFTRPCAIGSRPASLRRYYRPGLGQYYRVATAPLPGNAFMLPVYSRVKTGTNLVLDRYHRQSCRSTTAPKDKSTADDVHD
jgi:hypothetical protein